MTRGEIREQLESQIIVIQDILNLNEVRPDTAFYGYMNSAEYALSMAITRIGNVTEEDDGHETD